MGDYFSKQAATYSAARPTYPEALYDYLATIVPADATVWDCATGNGQAARDLAKHFAHVTATDLSEAQLSQAEPMENITFQYGTAEDSGLPDHSVDLVTVAQALHWFDFDAFYAEVRRVLRPDGVIAVWGYDLLLFADEAVNHIFDEFYHGTLWKGQYWPKERAHLDNRYADIPFPFKKIDTPDIRMEFAVNRAQFIAYLNSWSAVQRYRDQHGENYVEKVVVPQLEQVWPDEQAVKVTGCDLILKVGRV